MYCLRTIRQTAASIQTTILLLLFVVLLFATSGAQPSGTWSAEAPMPTARALLTSVALGGRVYAIGGDLGYGVITSKVERYDPMTDSWESVAPMPTPRATLSATVCGGKIYAVGGQFRGGPSPANFSNNIEAYDPLTDTWSQLAPMPTPRGGLSVVALRGKIYAIGGYQEGHSPQVMNIVEIYDPATNIWTAGTPMQVKRCAFNCVVIKDKIYAFSGLDGTGGATKTCEVYDPDAGTWTYIALTPIERSWFACDTLDGKAALVGGYLPYNLYPQLLFYDPTSDSWSQSDPMPTPRHGCSGACLSGTLFVTGGGLGNNPAVLNTVEAYVTSSTIDTVFITLDIKPGSCPNPLNVISAGSDWVQMSDDDFGDIVNTEASAAKLGPTQPARLRAVVPMAILGTADFDINMIDPASIQVLGLPSLRYAYEDVAGPVDEGAEECACTSAGPDGYIDLTFKIDRDGLIAALGEVDDGEIVPILVDGQLTDGRPFQGTDCVLIIADQQAKTAAPGVNSYPNPFNPTATISFSLLLANEVRLEVFNIAGQKVATLVNGRMEAGPHSVVWNAGDMASGVYLYRFRAGDINVTRKMVLMK